MQVKETPVLFDCQGEQLLGIIHQAVDYACNLGVLIIVGGPQYRIGSHRQFLLLARHLAEHGIPVMRFDVRGMGDSDGAQRRFDQLGSDIAAAVDCFLGTSSGLEQVVLWGLCDAASAAVFYAYQDDRVKGMVLLNPWVFTERGAAKTYLKHYYLQRLFSRDLWEKVFKFKFDFSQAIISLVALLKQAMSLGDSSFKPVNLNLVDESLALPIRVRDCLRQFSKPVLLILSGRDLTADEFRDVLKSDAGWQNLLSDERISTHTLAESDHTFSSAIWRNQVADWTLNWIKQL